MTLATISLLKKKIVEKCHRVDQNHKWNQNFFGFFAQNKKKGMMKLTVPLTNFFILILLVSLFNLDYSRVKLDFRVFLVYTEFRVK